MLIINADDFGLTESCSLAIAEAFDEKLISSTTACANGEFIEKAVSLAKEKGFIDKIGVHLNFNDGAPLSEKIKGDSFFCNDGLFHGKIDRYVKPSKESLLNFKAEVSAQIKKLFELGVNPTHIDSHHHIHTAPYLVDAVLETAREFGINKIRIHRNIGKIPFYKRVVKKLFNGNLKKRGFITVAKFGSLEDYFNTSVKADSSCEIMVHPDYDVKGALIDRTEITESGNKGAPLTALKSINRGDIVSYAELK